MSIKSKFFRNKGDDSGTKQMEEIFGSKAVTMMPVLTSILLLGGALSISNDEFRGLLSITVFTGYSLLATFIIYKIVKYKIRKSKSK